MDQNGEATFASVYRPFAMLMGGSGMVQNVDVANNLLSLNNEESRYVKMLSARNVIRSYAPLLGYEVKSSSQGAGRPWTPYVSAMSYAAGSNDSESFRIAMEKAEKVYAKEHGMRSWREARPFIVNSFAQRHPLRGMFQTEITRDDFRLIKNSLPDNLRGDFVDTINNYNRYMVKLGRSPYLGSATSKGAKDEETHEEFMQSLYDSAPLY
jgi:hypothetical protein